LNIFLGPVFGVDKTQEEFITQNIRPKKQTGHRHIDPKVYVMAYPKMISSYDPTT
jgi:hypothetical protein